MTPALVYRAYDLTPVQQFLQFGISQESFGDGIAFLRDLVGHSFRTIGVNLTHLRKDYVQSDFQQYYSKNKAKINLFLNNPTKRLNNEVFLPMPDGMIGRYPEVASTLATFLVTSFKTVGDVVIELANSIKSILDSDDKSPKDKAKDITTLLAGNTVYNSIIDSSKIVQTTLPKYFKKGRVTSSTIGEQFASKEEVKSTVNSLLLCGNSYKDFVNNQRVVPLVESAFRDLSDACARYAVDLSAADKKNFIEIVYHFVKDTALLCDFYGVTVTEALRVEHKFMLCLTQICNSAR